jgi:hypothetical protein
MLVFLLSAVSIGRWKTAKAISNAVTEHLASFLYGLCSPDALFHEAATP